MKALSLHAVSPALAGMWERASARERTMLVAAVVVVAGALAYTLAWRPMVADIARLSRDLPAAQSALSAARAQADNLVALQRAQAPVTGGDPRAAVERALAERNLRPAVSLLDVADGRVRLTFNAVRFAALPDFLQSLAHTDGLRAVEASVTARVEPGTVRAELTLAR
jgi:type II secretory pathway component PulM